MLQLFFLRHASKTSICNYSDENDNMVVSLSIQKTVFLFVIILFGIFLSVKIFAVEKIISYCQTSNQKWLGGIKVCEKNTKKKTFTNMFITGDVKFEIYFC